VTEKTVGPDHPRVAINLSNLATVYELQGRHDETEPLYKRAVDIVSRALGPDHPEVGSSLNNLAVLYKAQGRFQEAEPLLSRALSLLENTVGSNHPDVTQTSRNLGEVYRVLRSRLNQIQKAMIAASATAERKFRASLS
jgi:tetratricopeptide (TPR) repeat protein